MGGSSGTQQQQTQSQSSPWKPTQPELQSLIGQISGQNTGVTPYQQSAAQNLQSSASGIPNFGPTVANTANSFLSGIGNPNQQLQQAFGNLQGSLGGIADPNNLNPMSNPYLGPAMGALNSQITNQINGQFAGAGRDLSPANSTALAYGLSQGEAPLLMGQYNTNVGNLQSAANSIFSGAQGVNSGVLGNVGAGLGAAGGTAGSYTAPGTAQLGAGSAAYSLPFSNIGAAEGLTLPIAGLGGQTQGTSNTQTTQQASPLAMALGASSMLPGASWFSSPYGGSTPFTNALGFLGFGGH